MKKCRISGGMAAFVCLALFCPVSCRRQETYELLNAAADALCEQVDKWERQMMADWQFQHQLLFQSDVSVYGTEFYHESRLRLAKKYREYTLDRKYLYFVLETGLDPEKFSDTLLFVQFAEQ